VACSTGRQPSKNETTLLCEEVRFRKTAASLADTPPPRTTPPIGPCSLFLCKLACAVRPIASYEQSLPGTAHVEPYCFITALPSVSRDLVMQPPASWGGVSPEPTLQTLPTWTRVHDALCELNGNLGRRRPKHLSHCLNKERATAIVDSSAPPHDPLWTP
jgi:hypothetical protein